MQHNVFFVFLFPVIDWCNFIWILDDVLLQEHCLILSVSKFSMHFSKLN